MTLTFTVAHGPRGDDQVIVEAERESVTSVTRILEFQFSDQFNAFFTGNNAAARRPRSDCDYVHGPVMGRAILHSFLFLSLLGYLL